MKNLANLLALQNFINAYVQETRNSTLVDFEQQNLEQQKFSCGKTLLVVSVALMECYFPLAYVSPLGRHQLAGLPQVTIYGNIEKLSEIAIISLLLEDLQRKTALSTTSLIEKWLQSCNALQKFLISREADFDELIKSKQNFIESEQALILGHSMHPSPKSREGFIHEDWVKFSPESRGKLQLHFWLVHEDYIVEGDVFKESISEQLQTTLLPYLSQNDISLLHKFKNYKLLPLHPWQARYLQSKEWFSQLKDNGYLIDVGMRGWNLYPTTSVRTLASFESPWMFKTSLSVMITNSIRVNLVKECHRGELSCFLWRSELGRKILNSCPTIKALNDPYWMALKFDNKIIDESICIFREQLFSKDQQITCIASLCQDHPINQKNRFNTIFDEIMKKTNVLVPRDIAINWFRKFMEIGLAPLMYLYHNYGMAFEAHQQNVLLELEEFFPKTLWLRDNQGFYYIEDFSQEIVAHIPELNNKAFAVGPKDFVDERFSYYFFGNTMFGIINAIGVTGYVTENILINELRTFLMKLLNEYPDSTLLKGLLFNKTIPYKGNLLTRLHDLDELIAPVENQSVYIDLPNPLYIN